MDKGVRISFDEESDILYLSLKEGVTVDSEEIIEDVRVEYDEDGQVIGIEIFNITKMLATALGKRLKEILKRLIKEKRKEFNNTPHLSPLPRGEREIKK
jgi:uncharacterized protein YuzE